MRLARVQLIGSSLPDFAVSAGDGWLTFRSAGVEAPTVREAIDACSEVASARDRLADQRVAADQVRLLSPLYRSGKVLAIGLNYADHIRETGSRTPTAPVVFAKYPSSITGPFDPIVIDHASTEQGDYEAELAAVIGSACRKVDPEQALSHVFGYTVANDVSARDLQHSDAQFSRSKGMDTFCPCGPWITTKEEVADPQGLAVTSWVNGEVRQDSSTAEMIFGVAALISYLSQTMTLEPGDTILTGTPHGVGFAMTPPQFLRPGDRVACEIAGLGRIDNPVQAP